ncbi:MAG: FAD-binding oxidoreductase [Myxococcales bacterium]|nr:FAD-binding oxidoreductase [Myxococcales bacterium]
MELHFPTRGSRAGPSGPTEERLGRLLGELSEKLGGAIECGLGACTRSSFDGSGLEGGIADAIVTPEALEDVMVCIDACGRAGIPLTVRGGGTGRAGGAIPLRGGIVLDTTRLSALAWQDDVLVAGPGARIADVDRALAERGQALPARPWGDPAVATLGGLVGSGGAAVHARRTGGLAPHVRRLQAVTGSGELIRTGALAVGPIPTWDLTRLLVGSEGGLAVITEIALAGVTLRPTRRVERVLPNRDALAEALRAAERDSSVAAGSWFSASAARALWPERPAFPDGGVLWLTDEDDADPSGSAEPLASIETRLTSRLAELYPKHTLVRFAPRLPFGVIASSIDAFDAAARAEGLDAWCCGDELGTVHLVVAAQDGDVERFDRATDVLEGVVEAALDAGAAAVGAFGSGLLAPRWLRRERGMQLDLLNQLKAVFDPHGILNPGKLPKTRR